MMGRTIIFTTFSLLAAIGVVLAAQGEDLPSLEVLDRYALPEGLGSPVDVRWAGKDSIFLLLHHGGVTKVDLEDGLPVTKALLTYARSPGGLVNHLAVSGDTVLVSDAGARFFWSDLDAVDSAADTKRWETHGLFLDIDLQGDEVILAGVPVGDLYEEDPGAVLWQGDLSRLEKWDVIFESEAVANNYRVMNSQAHAFCAVRYLEDGGYVAALNFLGKVVRFSHSGKVKRTWTREELRRGGEPEEKWPTDKPASEARFKEFLTAVVSVDELLEFAEGPAVVVRDPRGRGTRWTLGLLDDEIIWYEIPTSNMNPVARLQGDVDKGGRVVLVGGPRDGFEDARVEEAEVIVLRLPARRSTNEEEEGQYDEE